MALYATWMVFVLLLASSQWRALRRPPPRKWRYARGLFSTVVVMSILVWFTDSAVGMASVGRLALSALVLAGVAAVSYAVNHALQSSRILGGKPAPARIFTLFVAHAALTYAIVLLVG